MMNPFLEERLDLIEVLIREIQNSIPTKKHEISEPKIVDLKTLLELRPSLGTKATVYKLVHEKRIPFRKPNGSNKLHFLLEEIDKYLLGEI